MWKVPEFAAAALLALTVPAAAWAAGDAADGEKLVTVVGSCKVGDRRMAMTGTRPVSRDVHRAVADAVAAAFVSLRV